MGKILASIGAILTICAVAACGSTGGKSHVAAAADSTTPTASAPSSSPSSYAPHLTKRQSRFVADMRSGYGFKGDDDETIAQVGMTVCTSREGGTGQAATVKEVRSLVSGAYGAITKLAERDMCPKEIPPPPPPKVIARFNGSGIQNTQSFKVPNNWHLSWEYWGCAGGSGNFIVSEDNTDGSSDFNGASVNELGSGRGPVATYIYGDAGRHYFSVDSECSWSLAVVVGGKQ